MSGRIRATIASVDESMITVFHGTSAAAWESIHVEGLKANMAMLGRAVYASADVGVALGYAVGRLAPYGDDETGVVVAFDVPEGTASIRGNYRLADVPPGRIRLHRLVVPGDARPLGAGVLAVSLAHLRAASVSCEQAMAGWAAVAAAVSA